MALGHDGTHRQCTNLLHLNWIQSKVVRVEFWPKFIYGLRVTGIAKLGHEVEERTIEKLEMLCKTSFEPST